MLTFQRNKQVSIVKEDDQTLTIHGILDDHIFGLELDLVVGMTDMEIRAIDGHWTRQETPECHRAVPFLQDAVGYCIADEDFGRRVNKMVGRAACPHFANLLIECGDAALEAAAVIQWQEAAQARPDLRLDAFLTGSAPEKGEAQAAPVRVTIENRSRTNPVPVRETPKDPGGGFVVDLHVHTYPASACSSVGVDQLIQEARRIGLDAICLTDHNYVWSAEAARDLTQKHGFLVLRGNEITTDQGDMLVFGMQRPVEGIITLAALKHLVDAADGFMVVAHPFRGFLVFNTSQIGLTVENAMQRPAFGLVQAVEVLNGKVTETENAFAAEVAKRLGLPATGGSDAHDLADVGKYATRFVEPIQNETDLLSALKSGAYAPFDYRRHRAR